MSRSSLNPKTPKPYEFRVYRSFAETVSEDPEGLRRADVREIIFHGYHSGNTALDQRRSGCWFRVYMGLGFKGIFLEV